MIRHALAAALVAALSSVVLGTAAAQGAPAPIVTDPAGDARDYGVSMIDNQARAGCMASTATIFACDHVPERPDELRESPAGVPAPPAFDILSITFDETPEAFLVTLEVAALDEAWPDAQRGQNPDYRGMRYIVAWHGEDGEGCWEGVTLAVFETGMEASMDSFDRSCVPEYAESPWQGWCNSWYWCSEGVSYEIEYGAPGRITWTVAREAMMLSEEGDTVYRPSAVARRIGNEEWYARVWSPAASDRSMGTLVPGYAVDLTPHGPAYTFATPAAPWPAPAPGEPHVRRPANPLLPQNVDVLALDVEETPETLRFAYTMGSVSDDPGGTVLNLWFEIPSGEVLDLVVERDDQGGWGGIASYWATLAPDLLATPASIPVPVDVHVTPGTPGEVAVTVERADLPPIRAGETTDLFAALAADGTDRVRYEAEPTPGVGLAVDSFRLNEWPLDYDVAPFYRFLHDTPADAYEGLLRTPDTQGDATMPGPITPDPTTPHRFDITYVEVRTVSDEESHMTIGLRDLSRATVPDGYRAMFFAMGAEKGDRATMIGYYREAGASSGEFLCAPDITVLTKTPRDPAEAVWTIIQGIVNVPPQRGGAGGPGAITFYVPHACFGDDVVVDGELRLDSLGAGTYLVRDAATGVTSGAIAQVDGVETMDAVALPVPANAAFVSPAAWYEAPFGLPHFWDMLGIGLAVVVGGTGAAMKLRRRKLDKRALADAKAREDRDVYRAALARAVHSKTAPDPARDEVMQALRRRLGISEREHAILELEARAEAGLAFGGLPAGTRFLGKYRVERQLGEGGFARTFLARDEKLARRVVLKIARWPSQEDTRRALHEARALAALDHPNIVKIHDADELADQLVLVLEHVPGGTLAQRLQSGRLPAADAVALADGLLAALEAAHAEGVVHRDVKPSNILLTREGAPKLADFGIAHRASDVGATATHGSVTGSGAGTIRYMAPEQARGQAVEARSDLYSAAVVLYEMLSGRPYLALDGLNEFEARAAIAEEPPQLPLEDVPAHVNALLAQALAKDPARRPASARAMRAMLAGEGAPLT